MAQAKDGEKLVPLAQDPTAAPAQAALESVKENASTAGASTRIIMNGKAFRQYSRTRRVRRRTQTQPFLWLWSPGTLKYSVRADWMLIDNARARKVKLEEDQVMRIAVGRFEDDEDLLYLWATDANDPDGFEVKRSGRHIHVNIADYLFEEGLAPQPGLKQKFDLRPSPQLIHNLPALCIYLNKAVAKGYFDPSPPKKKAESEETPPQDDEAESE